MTFGACSRRILLNFVTKTTPSAIAAMINGSLTAEMGGEIQHHPVVRPRAAWRKSIIRFDPISSDGVAGTRAATDHVEVWHLGLVNDWLELIHFAGEIGGQACRAVQLVGLMHRGSSKVRVDEERSHPVCAMTIARFDATSDFPSDGIVLVTARGESAPI